MHVSASILVNTVAYGLGEGKQLIKKMDSIGSQQFNVPKAFCVMNVNQKTKHREKSLNLINAVKTMQCYFTSDYSTSIPEYC